MAEEIVGPDFERPIIELENRIAELEKISQAGNNTQIPQVDISSEIKALKEKCQQLQQEIYSNLTPAQRVQLARHPKRPYTLDYVNLLFSDFTELHGDRNFADDRAIIAGMAFFNGKSVAVIGHQKGRTVEENIERNFGMAHPEGYRKALRVMKLAEKFSKPVIIFIDTPGAYPGIGAEERGQAEAIARNLKEMSVLKTPIICVVIGEGGSGGALGIGIADRILMLENSYYSVISPEGCASILFRDTSKSAEAAQALKITANDLFNLKVIDEIITEPLGGAHRNINQTAENIKQSLTKHLSELLNLSTNSLLELRYKKYRSIGIFQKKKTLRGKQK
ncbi:MAG: acetyl-CoA carboxylase carboxyltransferase subunit alpha [Elusimicrobiota bacterium]|nr:acetyl-CoA carboxylase carboxyltransferase subunit alpha [Elusimicrobiota bacterium]